MSEIQDGGPAFPHGPHGQIIRGLGGTERHENPAQSGMSLRDWFAGMALCGRVMHPDNIVAIGDVADKNGRSVADQAAIGSYELADAMLEARGSE